jgi:hypothetical protein
MPNHTNKVKRKRATTRPATGGPVRKKPVGRPARKPTPKPREPVDKQTFQARPPPQNRRPARRRPARVSDPPRTNYPLKTTPRPAVPTKKKK